MGRSREGERRSEKSDSAPQKGPKTPPDPGPTDRGSHEGSRKGGSRVRSGAARDDSRRRDATRSRSGSVRKELRKVDDLSAEIAHLRQQCAEKERNLQKMYSQLERPESPGRNRGWSKRSGKGKKKSKRRDSEASREKSAGEVKQVLVQREDMTSYNIPLNSVKFTRTLPSVMFSCKLRTAPPSGGSKTTPGVKMHKPAGELWPEDVESAPPKEQKPATPPPEKLPKPEAQAAEKSKEKPKKEKKERDIEKQRESFLVKNTVMNVKKEAERRTMEEIRKNVENVKKKEEKEAKEVTERMKTPPLEMMKPTPCSSTGEVMYKDLLRSLFLQNLLSLVDKNPEAEKLIKKIPVPKKIGQKRKKSFSSSTSTTSTSASSSSSDSDSDSDTSSSSSSSSSSSDSSSTSQEKPQERVRKPKVVPEVEVKVPQVAKIEAPVAPPKEEPVVESSREIECHTPPLPPQMINISPAKRTPIVMKLQSKVDKVTPTLVPIPAAMAQDDDDFTENLRAKSKSPSEDSDAKLVTTTCGPEVEEQARMRAVQEEEEARVKRKRHRSPSRQSSARRTRTPPSDKRRGSRRRFASPSPDRSRRHRMRRESPPSRRRRSSPRGSARRRRRSRSRSWSRSVSRSRSRSRSRSVSRERGRRRSPWRPPSVTAVNFLDKSSRWEDWDTVYEKASTERNFYPFQAANFDRPEGNPQWTGASVSPPHRSLDDRINSALSEPVRETPERPAAVYQPNYHHQFPTYTGSGFPRPYHSANEYSHYTESIYHHNNLQQQMIDPAFQSRPNLISIQQVEQTQPKPPNMLQKGNVIEVVPTTLAGEAAKLQPPAESPSPSSVARKPLFPPLGARVKVTKTAEQRKATREKKRMEKKMRKKKLEFEIKQLLSGAESVDITSEEILPEVEGPVKETTISVSAVKKVIFSDGVIPGASSSDSGVSSSDESISADTLSGMSVNQVKKYRKRHRKKKELNKENSLVKVEVTRLPCPTPIPTDLPTKQVLPPVRDPRRQPEVAKNGAKEEDTTNYPPPSPPPGDPPTHMVQPSLKREVQERPKKLLYFNAVHREKRMDIFSIYVPPSAFVKVQDPRLMKRPMLNRRRIVAPLFPANVYPRPPQPYPHLPPVQVSPAAGIRPAFDAYAAPASRIPVLSHAAVPPYPPPPIHPPPPPMHGPTLMHPHPPPMLHPPPPHFPPGAYYVNNGPVPPVRY